MEQRLRTDFSPVKHRSSVIFALLLSGTVVAKSLDTRMPPVTGKDLNGTPWNAPAGLPGGQTLVLVGFEESQQEAIDSWTQGLRLSSPAITIPWVEMPLIENSSILMRWFISNGMRSGIKEQRMRSHVWTAYTDKKAFMKACGMVSEDAPFAMVVDRGGQVLAMERGPYSKEGEARLLRALRRKGN